VDEVDEVEEGRFNPLLGFSYLLTLLQMPKKEKGVGREGK